MDDDLIYGVYFTVILFNYIVKMWIERKGTAIPRSVAREGIITGFTVYMLYRALAIPEVPPHMRVVYAILGVSACLAAAVFFITGKWGGRPRG